MRPGKRLVAVLLQEVLPTAVVGVVVFQFLRAVCFERYLVPSSSMEPTLHGHPQHGDLVLVNKLAYRWGNGPGRFDLVVVKNPTRPGSHMVKRLVGLGDERVMIRDGDLFIGAAGVPPRRVERDPMSHRDMWQPWFRWGVGSPWGPAQDEWIRGRGKTFRVTGEGLVLPPSAAEMDALVAEILDPGARQQRLDGMPPRFYPPGVLATEGHVDQSFICSHGARIGSDRPVRDAAMELELAVGPGQKGLLLVFEYAQRPFAFRYAPSGTVTLMEWTEELERFAAPALTGSLHIGFGHLDGRLFLAVNGVVVALHKIDTLDRAAGEVIARAAPRNLLMVSCAGAPVTVRSLHVHHDIHYLPSPVPRRDAVDEWFVDSDELFLLGDNPMDSRDSRDRRARRGDLLGRPLMVLGPWPRTRWLR